MQLSETITSDNPCVAYILLKQVITAVELVDCMTSTLAQLENVFTIMWKLSIRTGPAISMCTRIQGCFGFIQSYTGAFGSICRFSAYFWRCLTKVSIDSFILGHQTYALADAFIAVVPGWLTCSNWRNLFVTVPGTTTLLPTVYSHDAVRAGASHPNRAQTPPRYSCSQPDSIHSLTLVSV